MSNEKLGTVIHGIGASEVIDSSGEIISIKGIDTSSLDVDALVNTEHESKTTTSLIGKVLSYKKIFKKEDCENEHHRHFWDKVEAPYLYIKAVLFDKFGHSGAMDAVAMMKFDKSLNKEETRQVCGFSIEGSRLDKEGNKITKCIARKISWTAYPCNKTCVAEILENDDKPIEITAKQLLAAFKKSEEMEYSLKKGEEEKPKEYKPSRTFTSEEAPSNLKVGDRIVHNKKDVKQPPSRPGKPITPSRTFTPQNAPSGLKVGDRISYTKQSNAPTPQGRSFSSEKAPSGLRVGDKIVYSKKSPKPKSATYKDPDTWKNEKNSVRKTILKSMSNYNIKTRMMLSEKKAMEKKELLKNMADDAFELLQGKQDLVDFVKSEHPEMNDAEVLAFAKTYAFIQMKKSEAQMVEIVNQIDGHFEGADFKKSENLNKGAKDRCWEGYEPTPGKKAYSKGSCRPIKKSPKVEEMKIDLKKPVAKTAGKNVDKDKFESCVKQVKQKQSKKANPYAICNASLSKDESVPDNEIHLYKKEDGTAELIWGSKVSESQLNKIIQSELKDWIEKKEKPFHGYNPKKHSREGGLSDEYRKKYNRETGSDLKRPVTGKVKAGSKASKRRKSFCARMSGVKGPTSKDGKLTPKGAALKRWKC